MSILKEIRECTLCADVLPLGPRPILQMSRQSRLLIIGQAPGLMVHQSGKPWNDASGVRLRQWLKLTEQQFYDAKEVAIVPMGFCYPGRGKSGDKPPRPECSARWMDTVLHYLKHVEFKIIVGGHAAKYFCGKEKLEIYIREYSHNSADMIVLPHPSPRNNIWLAKNLWFKNECLPALSDKLCRKVS